MVSDRDLAKLLGWTRIGIGIAGALMPATFAGLWTGRAPSSVAMNMATRGLAARDVALGAGILTTLDDGGARPWLLASAAVDAADAVGTLSSVRELGLLRSVGLLGLEVGAAMVGVALADSLD